MLAIRAHLHQTAAFGTIINKERSTHLTGVYTKHNLGPDVDHLDRALSGALKFDKLMQGYLIQFSELLVWETCKK